MAKKKLQHFAEMKTFSCVFEPDNELMRSGSFHLKGRWNKNYFENNNPITLELGCGKGEYALALAEKYPDRNFIGVDVKGARLWRGSKFAEENKLKNVAFLRTKIEFIDSFFDEGEIDSIWLTFSDPQPKDKKGTKRLTGQYFLKKYARILKPKGLIHLKADSNFLIEATKRTIEEEKHQLLSHHEDIYGAHWEYFSEAEKEILSTKTFYEKKFLEQGKNIHYLKFSLNG